MELSLQDICHAGIRALVEYIEAQDYMVVWPIRGNVALTDRKATESMLSGRAQTAIKKAVTRAQSGSYFKVIP
jgi:hypothetical protein